MRRSLSASSFTRRGGFGRGGVTTLPAVLGTTTAIISKCSRTATIDDAGVDASAQIVARALTWEFATSMIAV